MEKKEKRNILHARKKKILPEMAKLRTELGSLAALMTRYTLQMSSDDCGGLSEYVEFFSSLRGVCSVFPFFPSNFPFSYEQPTNSFFFRDVHNGSPLWT